MMNWKRILKEVVEAKFREFPLNSHGNSGRNDEKLYNASYSIKIFFDWFVIYRNESSVIHHYWFQKSPLSPYGWGLMCSNITQVSHDLLFRVSGRITVYSDIFSWLYSVPVGIYGCNDLKPTVSSILFPIDRCQLILYNQYSWQNVVK